MSWELLEFTLEETSGPGQVFNFGARLNKEGADPCARPEPAADSGGAQGRPSSSEFEFRGDGIYLARTGQLRINRESELTALLGVRFAAPPAPLGVRKRHTFDPAPLVADLTDLLRSRVAAPPVVAVQAKPAVRLAAAPAPAIGSVAYMN